MADVTPLLAMIRAFTPFRSLGLPYRFHLCPETHGGTIGWLRFPAIRQFRINIRIIWKESQTMGVMISRPPMARLQRSWRSIIFQMPDQYQRVRQ
jgi:hypothetical protein